MGGGGAGGLLLYRRSIQLKTRDIRNNILTGYYGPFVFVSFVVCKFLGRIEIPRF